MLLEKQIREKERTEQPTIEEIKEESAAAFDLQSANKIEVEKTNIYLT